MTKENQAPIEETAVYGDANIRHSFGYK